MEENRNEELSKEAAETETTETAAEEQAATEDTREAAAEPEEKDDASSEEEDSKRKIKKTHRLKSLQIGYSGRWQNLTTSANVPKKRRQQCLRLARRA